MDNKTQNTEIFNEKDKMSGGKNRTRAPTYVGTLITSSGPSLVVICLDVTPETLGIMLAIFQPKKEKSGSPGVF
jgi:hypothetical protein